MSFVDRRIESRPTRGEAPFGLNEVFFSRTDSRGVILAGNYVFRRVSNYEWEELLGAPHNTIRHPDMPKGVFKLFWDTIQSGQTMGAYVKNKSKDGLHYWVYAVVVPCAEGYLSARIKPSSKLFDDVQGLYAKLLAAEQNEDLSPEESAERLKSWVVDQGYDDYRQFATKAISEELIARDTGLDNEPDQMIVDLCQTLDNAKTLVGETEGLIKDFDAMHTIPHNLRVIASRIEPSGGPVTVLSQNYGAMSREMSDWFAAHVMGKDSNFAVIEAAVDDSLFVECMVRVLKECDIQLQKERRSLGEMDMQGERDLLAQLVSEQLERAGKGLDQVEREASRIMHACQVMHRHFLGLSSTRVLCKIESARLPESGETLADIIDQLGVFQERISQRLERIARLSSEIRSLER
ncbi:MULTISPECIES: PAS domain-containing protein [Phaeobacter]|uniref:Aerotaxis receptor-like protein n=1 Tax=Phaeobacter piscinae TaxID=1580596 RepID=A0ABM6PB09_9RHOB|nr:MULTISPECIES: PAS domain-containing protein [Phaeobacter]ATG34843.1 aerotaxis receptor-like protein [Phaeobacter piscinae]ATG38806.1 aerotaxis receptor-like protein [Phaeobacter piscinae]AUQ85363.1 aerotaxis receptor-like protein [Phaeobacter piscinae]AUR23247.1 aerotaxis receptor-like protein [Phaeobacter piscinae]KII12617.1 chemotaxis protein [Phaeobacter sp. S60]